MIVEMAYADFKGILTALAVPSARVGYALDPLDAAKVRRSIVVFIPLENMIFDFTTFPLKTTFLVDFPNALSIAGAHA